MSIYDAIVGENPFIIPDEFAIKEQLYFEELSNKRFSQDTKLRLKLTYWAMNVVSIYLLMILIILVLNNNYLKLSDTVMSVLLGTTTANILGLMFIVLKGYFTRKMD